jgi:hypothetical protein
VLGYISFATVQEQRIFITRPLSWTYPIPVGCNLLTMPNTKDSLWFDFGIGSYAPVLAIIDPSTGAIVRYTMSLKTCVDCTLQGGTTTKPSFWQ